MHLFELLSKTALEHPDCEAFIDANSRCTFSQMHESSNAFASYLHDKGVRHGMHVALLCRNGIPFVKTVFALLRLGAVCVPLNWRLTPQEINVLLQHAAVEWLLYDEDSQETLPPDLQLPSLPITAGSIPLKTEPELLPPPASNDTACIIYTAGTSDSPRGVVLSHANLLANSTNYCKTCGFKPGQRELATTQLFHISTFSRIFTYVRSATTCYLMKRFSSDACFDIIKCENITSITQTPTMYRMLLQANEERRRSGTDLKRIITGASAMSPTERQDLRELFPNADLYDIYGQTEASPGISVLGPQNFFSKTDSVGKPMPGVQVAIVDEEDQELPSGSIGEITVAGANIMQGYFNNEPATKEVLIDGRLHTGDMGHIDEEGFLYIDGRKKDIIITGGINVYPGEIENVLRQYSGVADCAVFSVPDKKWGEALVAAVVLQGATIDEINTHCRQHLAGFKCPNELLPVSDIPRNAAHKIIRKELISLWNTAHNRPC